MKILVAWVCVLLLSATQADAQDLPSILPIPDLDPEIREEIAQGLIAFVNFATAPGISGATFTVHEDNAPDSDLIRSSLGFATDITIRNRRFNGFVSMALAGGSLDRSFDGENDLGSPIRLEIERRILSARVSGGLSFPMTAHFKFRPYLTAIGARLETDSTLTDLLNPNSPPDILSVIASDSKANTVTVGGTLQLLYDRWFGQQQLKIDGNYTTAKTRTFNESNEYVNAEGQSDIVLLRVRWTGPTRWETANRPWRWNVFGAYTEFLDQPKAALGFSHFYEIGGGIEYEMNTKPLDWFGLRWIGLRAGMMFGDDLDGYMLGISFR